MWHVAGRKCRVVARCAKGVKVDASLTTPNNQHDVISPLKIQSTESEICMFACCEMCSRRAHNGRVGGWKWKGRKRKSCGTDTWKSIEWKTHQTTSIQCRHSSLIPHRKSLSLSRPITCSLLFMTCNSIRKEGAEQKAKSIKVFSTAAHHRRTMIYMLTIRFLLASSSRNYFTLPRPFVCLPACSMELLHETSE